MRNAYEYSVLVVNQYGEITLGRPRRKCEDNIKMDLNKKGTLLYISLYAH
jgi:hypothetical protein